MTRTYKAGLLEVRICENRKDMGQQAANAVKKAIRELLKTRKEINMVFAAAPSQNEFLEALKNSEDIAWSRINAFHMDEYIGLSPDAPQGFGNFLKARLFGALPFASVHYLDGNADDPESECKRYAALLEKYPVDIVCMGIGENGHLAFNDPPVADFGDTKKVKIVTLDHTCRQQQVHDGCFTAIEEVPLQALTLTIPVLTGAARLFGVVPGKTKAAAIKNTLEKPVKEAYPSTILRCHRHAILFLDTESSVFCKESREG